MILFLSVPPEFPCGRETLVVGVSVLSSLLKAQQTQKNKSHIKVLAVTHNTTYINAVLERCEFKKVKNFFVKVPF